MTCSIFGVLIACGSFAHKKSDDNSLIESIHEEVVRLNDLIDDLTTKIKTLKNIRKLNKELKQFIAFRNLIDVLQLTLQMKENTKQPV